MPRTETSGVRIGTFDGRAGSQDWGGLLSMAESKIDLVITDRWVEESGEEMVELTATAELPANEIRLQWTLPRYSAEKLVDAYPG